MDDVKFTEFSPDDHAHRAAELLDTLMELSDNMEGQLVKPEVYEFIKDSSTALRECALIHAILSLRPPKPPRPVEPLKREDMTKDLWDELQRREHGGR